MQVTRFLINDTSRYQDVVIRNTTYKSAILKEVKMNKTILTTSAGAPVADDNNSISVGARGPLTYDNHYLFEKLAHFNRERISERVARRLMVRLLWLKV